MSKEPSINDINTKLEVLTNTVLNYVEQEKQEHRVREDKIDKILIQTTLHNGRMKTLELWKAQVDGGQKVIKGFWLIGGVFVVSMVFGMFQTYVTVQAFPNKQELNEMIVAAVKGEVASQLNGYVLEVVK